MGETLPVGAPGHAECVEDLPLLVPARERFMGGSPSILAKAFAILGTFEGESRQLNLSQISRRSGLPKSTAHRVINMLIELGALDREDEDYRMGSRMFSFGSRFPPTDLRDLARAHLQALAVCTRQDVQLAVLQDRDALILELLGGNGAAGQVSVGDRLAAHQTALGKALLAFSEDFVVDAVLSGELARRTAATITDPRSFVVQLSQVRVSGFAVDEEEAVRGMRCVAVPVLAKGRPLAAVSVAYPAAAGSGHVFVGALQETAARIARAVERDSGSVRRAV